MLVTKLKAILPGMGHGWHQHKCLPWCAIRTAFRPLSFLFQMWTIEGSWYSDFCAVGVRQQRRILHIHGFASKNLIARFFLKLIFLWTR